MHDEYDGGIVDGNTFLFKEVPLFGDICATDLNLLAFLTREYFLVKLLLQAGQNGLSLTALGAA